MTKTLVKICGITTKEQAFKIAEMGVDAIGIISVEESPRYIVNKNKVDIFKNLKSFFPKIKRVSVVKNCPADLIIENFRVEPIETTLQLHGDEGIDYCQKIRKEIPDVEIWKAFRINSKKDLEKIKPYEKFVDAILLDSWNKETYGGSGQKINSAYLEDLNFCRPWWLAGGISIDWIDEILNIIKPHGLDISSSIETSPGVKDLKKTESLIKYLKNQ